MVLLGGRRAPITVREIGTLDVEIIYRGSRTIDGMSVWFGAYEAVQELLYAVIGLRNDTRFRDSSRWTSLEQLSLNTLGAAKFIEGLPETEAFATELREMGNRYATQNSVTNDELGADIDRLRTISQELFRRMTEGPG